MNWQKKSSEPFGSEDCTLVCLVLRRLRRHGQVPDHLEAFPKALSKNRRRRCKRFFPHPAGLLTLGFSYSPGLPISLSQNSGFPGFRPRSQRRDRSRITRDSLLNVAYRMDSSGFFSIFFLCACQRLIVVFAARQTQWSLAGRRQFEDIRKTGPLHWFDGLGYQNGFVGDH